MKECSRNMDSNSNVFYAAGLPVLISTGITFIYFFLRAYRYVFHAIPHQTKGGLAMAMPGCGKQKHSPTTGTESDSEVCHKIPGHFKGQYDGGPKILRAPFSIKKGARPMPPFRGDPPEHTEESTFRENAK